jgi:rRNA maturation endonuclease Nob1
MQVKDKKDKRFRRRCKNCGKRVNLKIFYKDGKRFCKCPICLSEARFFYRGR